MKQVIMETGGKKLIGGIDAARNGKGLKQLSMQTLTKHLKMSATAVVLAVDESND